METQVKLVILVLFIGTVLVAGCGETPAPVNGSGVCRLPIGGIIYPVDTATPIPDPNLTPTATPTSTPTLVPGEPSPTPTSTPTSTPHPLPWCTPTPGGAPGGGGGGRPNPNPPPPPEVPPALNGGITSAMSGSGVDSITINSSNQTVKAVAISQDSFTVVWEEAGKLFAASSRGATQLTVYEIGKGDTAALTYGQSGRLHMVYENDGELFFRSVKDGHIGTAADERIGNGENPEIAVNQDGWPVVFYQSAGGVVSQTRLGDGTWEAPRFAFVGNQYQVVSADDSSLFAAVRDGGSVRIYRQIGGGWLELASYDPSGLIGAPHIDVDQDWVYVSWVTEKLDPISNDWPRRRPEYKGSMPFVNRVHSGSNAQQYFTTWGIHDAGIYQQFSTAPGASLTASAMYMGWSCGEPSSCDSALPNEPNPPSGNGANMMAQVCLDPTGGVDVFSSAVVCSSPVNSLDVWTPIGVSAVAASSRATIYLRTAPDLPRHIQDVYWDSVTLSGGALVNPELDGDPYYPHGGVAELKVAEGWAPFYIEDSEEGVGSGRYEVHAVYSSNGGNGFSEPFSVAINAESGNGRTGAIAPHSYPVIEAKKDLVSFVFLYMAGNPSPVSGDVRYGHVSVVVCDVGTQNCDPDASGERMLPRAMQRPAENLVVDVARNSTALVVWDAYQGPSAQAKDIYSLMFSPSGLRVRRSSQP